MSAAGGPLSLLTTALDSGKTRGRGGLQDRQAALALAKRPQASPKARRRSLKAVGAAASHTEPLLAARRVERELKTRLRQLEDEGAAARAAAAEERSRSAALREGVRRAQEARRAAERQRDEAVAAADGDRKTIAGLRARARTLQASLEQVGFASMRVSGGVTGPELFGHVWVHTGHGAIPCVRVNAIAAPGKRSAAPCVLPEIWQACESMGGLCQRQPPHLESGRPV